MGYRLLLTPYALLISAGSLLAQPAAVPSGAGQPIMQIPSQTQAQILPPNVAAAQILPPAGAPGKASPPPEMYGGLPIITSAQPAPLGPVYPPHPEADMFLSPVYYSDGSFSSRDNNIWMSADYVMGWMKGMNLPPLVTTGLPGTAQSAAGVLGTPGTTTLFGGNAVDTGMRSGMRLGAGWWFSPDRGLGLEAGFLGLSSQNTGFAASSDGSQILARPFTDAVAGTPQAVLVAFPGSSSGSITVSAQSAGFFTGNIDFVDKTYETSWYRLVSIFGYRYYSYNENLNIGQSLFPTSTNFVPGTQIVSTDHFGTRNVFNGVDVGLRQEFYWNNFSFEVLTKIAMGTVDARASVNGSQVVNVPGTAPVINNIGVLALGSNSNTFNRNHMQILPELGLTAKWQVCNCLQFRFGYSLLLLNGVARAANQVNTAINPANFTPGATGASPNQPTFTFHNSDVWIQTLNFGFVLTF